jgi:hypothetical protein
LADLAIGKYPQQRRGTRALRRREARKQAANKENDCNKALQIRTLEFLEGVFVIPS